LGVGGEAVKPLPLENIKICGAGPLSLFSQESWPQGSTNVKQKQNNRIKGKWTARTHTIHIWLMLPLFFLQISGVQDGWSLGKKPSFKSIRKRNTQNQPKLHGYF